MGAATAGEIGRLEQAFQAFNQLSSELEQSYRGLELELARLNRKLRRTQAECDAHAARFADVLSMLPAGVVTLDQSGRVTHLNPTANDLFGEHILGRRWTQVAQEQLTACNAGSDLKHVNGKRLNLQLGQLGDGGRILLFTDITEMRELEELLSRSERLSAMGQMAATLAHQIRTPLASAMLYLTGAREGTSGESGRFLGLGIERLHDLEKLVKDMLVFARGAPPARQVRIADILAEVHRSVSPGIPDGCHLVIDGKDVLHEFTGNRTGLVTALTNLVTNAFESSPRGVVVTISVAVVSGRVEFTVRDNGPGIDSEMAKKVFQPFFSTRDAGTGLGLAVVKAVTDAHGGEVALTTPPGGGTQVGIELPILDQNEIPESAAL